MKFNIELIERMNRAVTKNCLTVETFCMRSTALLSIRKRTQCQCHIQFMVNFIAVQFQSNFAYAVKYCTLHEKL